MGRCPERLVGRANAFCHQGYEIGKAINTNKKKEGVTAKFLEGWPSPRSCCALRVTHTYDNAEHRAASHRQAVLRRLCPDDWRSRGSVKRLDQVAGDLRFADVASCSQILSGSNEVYALVNGEKDDARWASAAPQLFRNDEATYIAQIHVQENNVRIQGGGFFKH
jgi:hypothetical protein